MNLQKTSTLLTFFFLISTFLSPTTISDTTKPVIFSNIAQSEKRVLDDDPLRDEKLLTLTGHDHLTAEIIDRHSLIVGSKMVMSCQRSVYSWLVDNIRVSAALSRLFGSTYSLSPGFVYAYHGEDGEGLSIDFYRAYRDSASTVYVGDGEIKFFLFSISGSFINFLEYYNTGNTTMTAQSCMYVSVNNYVARLFTRIIFAISDVEEGIMEKILSLDDTAFRMVKTLIEDPHLYLMLKEPDTPAPEGASELAVNMRDTVVRKFSSEKARELGQLIETARLQMK